MRHRRILCELGERAIRVCETSSGFEPYRPLGDPFKIFGCFHRGIFFILSKKFSKTSKILLLFCPLVRIGKQFYELLAFCFTMFGWLLLFLLISIALYTLLAYRFPVLAVIVAIVTIAPIVFCYLHEVFRMFYGLYMIKKDNLVVVQDQLVGIADHEIALNILEGARRIRFFYIHNFFTHVHAFYFAQYDRYVLTNERAMFQSSACSDTFYIVMYNDGKLRPALVYNTKIYELKE